MRTLLADGNFKQDHLAMRCDSDDVSLNDGLGYMVGRKRFDDYIRSLPAAQKSDFVCPTVGQNTTILIVYCNRSHHATNIELSLSRITPNLISILRGLVRLSVDATVVSIPTLL